MCKGIQSGRVWPHLDVIDEVASCDVESLQETRVLPSDLLGLYTVIACMGRGHGTMIVSCRYIKDGPEVINGSMLASVEPRSGFAPRRI